MEITPLTSGVPFSSMSLQCGVQGCVKGGSTSIYNFDSLSNVIASQITKSVSSFNTKEIRSHESYGQ